MQKRYLIASGSILIGFAVFTLKFIAWHVTGSAAFFSDALESIVNILASFMALFAIWFSTRPADKEHPYGHAKAELFSAAFEGAMIIIAAFLILDRAWGDFLHPHMLTAPWEGIIFNGLSTVLNCSWGLLLIMAGRKMKSPALTGDGQHLISDVVTSVGIIIGFLLTVLTGWLPLDSIVAALAALYILYSGTRTVLSSWSKLLDEAAPPEILKKMEAVFLEKGQGALQVHDIKTREAGLSFFMECHLVVPDRMTVFEAHEICDRLEEGLEEAFPGIHPTIHVEPEAHYEKTGGTDLTAPPRALISR